jgi:hypothetical protein
MIRLNGRLGSDYTNYGEYDTRAESDVWEPPHEAALSIQIVNLK